MTEDARNKIASFAVRRFDAYCDEHEDDPGIVDWDRAFAEFATGFYGYVIGKLVNDGEELDQVLSETPSSLLEEMLRDAVECSRC